MTRRPDWPERLEAFIRSRRNVPFAYGTNDCVVYVCDAIEAMTGEDIFAELRGTYDSELGARRKLIEIGGIEAWFSQRMRRHQTVLRATRGDVGLMPGENGWQPAAICLGSHWCGPSDEGILMVPISTAVAAWAV